MPPSSQSDVFGTNIIFWKSFGMWLEETSSRPYKLYSAVFFHTSCSLYFFLFTLSLLFTPIDFEIIVAQLMFYFIEMAGLSKICMIVFRREKILELFEMLDTAEFLGDEEIPQQIVENNKNYYKKYWKACALFYYTGTFFLLFLPVIQHFVLEDVDLEMPLCQYFFLSDNIRERYFVILFLYQFFGFFVHINCNVNTETFINGLIMMAITQYKILNWKMSNMKLRPNEEMYDKEEQEHILEERLKKCLQHYELVTKYCEDMQKILSIPIFVQFGTGSITICQSMCALLRPMTLYDWFFMGLHIGSMTLEVFLPSFLGTQLTYESQNLVFSAYCGDWLPRRENFKSSVKLFVERAKRPVIITGMQLFLISLETFISIIKTAYSFFTLLKSVHEE